ncbi:MAG TPA: hypothetical protein VK891_11335 [Euzebyales bacterium]|nr:hypothetical protein [Euzebyales bacterium]
MAQRRQRSARVAVGEVEAAHRVRDAGVQRRGVRSAPMAASSVAPSRAAVMSPAPIMIST